MPAKPDHFMRIIRVAPADTAIVQDILQNHIDATDRRQGPLPAEHLETLLADDRTYLLAALDDGGRVAGYGLAYRFPSLYAAEWLAYLYDIEVAPAHRRRGIGTGLIRAVLEILQQAGVREMWLGTGVDNAEGQGLFSATGAVKTGETFNDYTYYLTDGA